MDWAILWRAGFAAACAGWLLTVLVALRSRRLLRAQLEALRARDTFPDQDTLRMLRVDQLVEESAAHGDTLVSDVSELLARLRDTPPEAGAAASDGACRPVPPAQ